jgi:YHS domain-containing protein
MTRMFAKVMMLLLVMVCNVALADPPVFLNDKGVALQGYDAVAFFTVKKPTKGKASISAKYNDATYYFASAANRSAFEAEPAKYVPQYGGYCAYAASLGQKAPADSRQWTVLDGKLYLNYDARIQKQWTGDRAAAIEKADKLWDGIKNN